MFSFILTINPEPGFNPSRDVRHLAEAEPLSSSCMHHSWGCCLFSFLFTNIVQIFIAHMNEIECEISAQTFITADLHYIISTTNSSATVTTETRNDEGAKTSRNDEIGSHMKGHPLGLLCPPAAQTWLHHSFLIVMTSCMQTEPLSRSIHQTQMDSFKFVFFISKKTLTVAKWGSVYCSSIKSTARTFIFHKVWDDVLANNL